MDSMVAFGRSMIQLMWVQICAGSKMNVRPLRPISVSAAKHEPLVIDWQANYERAMAGRSADIPRGSEESSIPLVPVQEAAPKKGRVPVKEAAEMLGVTVNTIVNWVKKGKISGEMVRQSQSGHGKARWMVDLDKMGDIVKADGFAKGDGRVYTVKAVHYSNRDGRWCPMGNFTTYAEAEKHMKMLAADDPTHAYTFEVVQMR